MTELEIDGADLTRIEDLFDAIGAAVGAKDGYFGWDLHSFHDCVHGGFGLESPFCVRITNSERVFRAMGYEGYAAYCDRMLEVLDRGGRGLVTEDEFPGGVRAYWTEQRDNARKQTGVSLLDHLDESMTSVKSRIVFLDSAGRVLRTCPVVRGRDGQ